MSSRLHPSLDCKILLRPSASVSSPKSWFDLLPGIATDAKSKSFDTVEKICDTRRYYGREV